MNPKEAVLGKAKRKSGWQQRECEDGWNPVSTDEQDNLPEFVQTIVQGPLVSRTVGEAQAGPYIVELPVNVQNTFVAHVDTAEEEIVFKPVQGVATRTDYLPRIGYGEAAFHYRSSDKRCSLSNLRKRKTAKKVSPVPERGDPTARIPLRAKSFLLPIPGEEFERKTTLVAGDSEESHYSTDELSDVPWDGEEEVQPFSMTIFRNPAPPKRSRIT